MNDNDYYKDLGVTECASTEEIKSAFYALAKQYHPDKTGTNDGTDFRRVREAYDVLSDPVSRAAYDGDVQNTHSRTAQYEAEEGAKAGKYDRDHGPERADTDEDRSRYQKKPFHYFSPAESASASSSSSGSAHGLAVKMSSHPATTERCTLRTNEWREQIAGTEICVFCLSPVERGGSRCLGCEVMACGECLKKVVDQEHRVAFDGFSG